MGCGYLREADSAAERRCDANVVAHPQVDSVDAAAHVDGLLQGLALMQRKRKSERGEGEDDATSQPAAMLRCLLTDLSRVWKPHRVLMTSPTCRESLCQRPDPQGGAVTRTSASLSSIYSIISPFVFSPPGEKSKQEARPPLEAESIPAS